MNGVASTSAALQPPMEHHENDESSPNPTRSSQTITGFPPIRPTHFQRPNQLVDSSRPFQNPNLPPLPQAKPAESSPKPATPKIGPYDVEKTIGKGNHAVVKKARHKVTKTEVAIKIIDKRRLDPENVKKIEREVKVLQRIRHPHIIKLYQVIDTPSILYLITEYAPNGEIYDMVHNNKRLTEDEARHKFWQIISAVEYLHKNGIVHRDLKAENLLLDSNHDIKLADFGFSNFYEKENTLDTFCGSPPYAAPEIFEGKLYTGPEIDVWSLGVVLYVLVSGVLPFEGINLQALRDRVLSGRIRIPFFMSTECEQLIRRMLTINPAKRPSIDQIKRHKWMKFEEFEPRYNVAKYLTIDSKEPHPQVMKIIQNMGLNMETVENSLKTEAYDNYHGVYLLLLERLRESSLKLHQLQMYEQQKQSQKRIQEVQNRRRQSDAPPQPRPLLKGLREHSTFQTTDCSDVAPESAESTEEAKQTKVVEKPLAATTQATVKPINVSTTTITSTSTTLTTVQPSTTSSGHGTSDENDRCSTLSRQSTIGTIGSIDEGVESDMNGSSQSRATFSSRELDNEGSGNSLLTFDPNSVENPDLMSSLSLNSCPSNAEASQNLRPANLPPCCVKALAEERQLQQNPATATNSTETSPCASPQRRCFGEGWRASDNAMFDSLTQPFPTGELGKSKGVTDVSKPTASHLADKMRKMRLTGPANVAGIAVGGGAKMAAAVHHHHVHPHRHVMLGGVPKRISLPENLEFQPQMLLNLKQAIHVEKQLGAEKSDTNKVLKVRMAQQQQKRLTKARMQMFRQQNLQSYQKQVALPGPSLMSRLSEEPPSSAPLSPIEDLKHEDAMDTS